MRTYMLLAILAYAALHALAPSQDAMLDAAAEDRVDRMMCERVEHGQYFDRRGVWRPCGNLEKT